MNNLEIKTIRLSEKAKGQLIQLKRKTGIEQWNVLCRWAFCLSLAEPSVPPEEDIPSDSSVEMSWRVFTGENSYIYEALLKQRLNEDSIKLTKENLLYFLKVHLHRGISFLNNKDINSIKDLIKLSK